MPAPTLANLGLYAAQAALLIGVLALMVAALRPTPALRLAACRGVLVVLFLLPFQALLRESPAALDLRETPAAGAAFAADAVDAQVGRRLPWAAIVGSLLAFGVALRLGWLAVGLARLRRLARDLSDEAASAALDAGVHDEIAALQADLGTRARVVFVDRVPQPVAFGIAPAVVLLPSSLLAAPADRRRAIICHELLHVRRRDWLWVLAEELALTVLWFHPAAWWLVGELQLAREQVVDRLTVAATGARREYMDALFSAADLPSAPPLLSGFLRRRHLARRLVALAEEVAMSRARLVVAGVSMVAVLLGGGAVALAAWPLAPMPSSTQEPAKDVMTFQPRPAQPVRVAHRVDVPFPTVAVGADFAEIVVDVEATVDADGAVSAARPVTFTVHGRDDAGASTTVTPVVEPVAAAAVDVIRQWRFEAPDGTPALVLVRVRFAAETRQATVTGITAIAGFKAKQVLQVGGAVKPPRKIVNVSPIYPQEAQDAKVQGVVTIDMTVEADGSVAEAWVVRSIPMLDEAALQAVRQWRYEPTLMNGVPTPVRVTATINFTLEP